MKARFCGNLLLWKSEVVKTSREGPLSTRRSGRRGIRTPGTQIRVRQFSKLVVSAQKIAGRHADARKDFFCGIVTVCRRAVGSVDGARGVQMSFAGHLHAVYPENGIMVFSVWDASRLIQI